MTHKIDYSRILEVQIRDGVARQDTPVWWHEEYRPMYLRKGEPSWRNIVEYPLYYSLEKPEFVIKEDETVDYGYVDPYED